MKNYLHIMRPLHWIKNILVFAALVFSRKLGEPLAFGRVILAFFCFSLASSAVYIINDIIDRHVDKLHPEKSKGPITSGKVQIKNAIILSIICAAASNLLSLILTPTFTLIIAAYIGLMVIYSLILKKIMILDCIVIATGFCLRAVAGAVVIDVFISPWLIICTFALCLFLSFGKRRSEIVILSENGESFRATLSGYTPELLAHMIDVTSGLAIICFILYAVDERTMRIFGSNNLIYTTPMVLYCVFRFSAMIQKGKYSNPVQLIIRDLPFQVGFVLWLIFCIIIIYT